jgi:GNAT superfamily N-acetyltransferase
MDPTASDPITTPTLAQNNAERLTIRRIVPEDAEAASLLSGQLGYESTTGQMLQRIQRLSGCTDSQAVFVACLQDKETSRLVGWIEIAITYHLQSEPFVLIGGLVVLEGLRGLGIGKRLCDEAEAWTRARGIKVLRVTSRSTRPDAHRFYLRDGYMETKTSKVFEKLLS